jgi:hypothetical protein
MNKNIKLLSLFLLIAVIGFAQKPKVLSGSAPALKNIKTWNVSIEFEGAEVHKKPPYQEFINERVAEMNAQEDETGDEWKEDWNKAFERSYNNKFCLLMNKYLSKSGVTCDKNKDDAQGSIVIKTYWIYLGYANPMRIQASKVSSKVYFLDASGKELFVVDMVESPGNAMFTGPSKFGFNPEGEFARLAESYAKCGKDLAGYLSKKAYK